MKRRAFLMSPLVGAAALALPEPSTSWVTHHPRLFFDAARIRAIRARIKNDPGFAQRWQELFHYADHLAGAEFVSESAAEQGRGDDANYGRPSQQIAAMGLTLGLAYHVSGRERYAAKLRDALLHYAGYRTWHGPGFIRRQPPWHSELNTARFCFGAAVCYDALYSFLSPAERQTAAEALTRMGVQATLEDWLLPETRIHALDSMGHNWWAVCTSNAGVAALSLLGDDPNAAEWIRRVNEGLAQWFAYKGDILENKSLNFDAKGAFYESVNYANYALSEYLKFRLAFSNVFPGRQQPDYPPLSKTCEYFFYTFYPSSTAPLAVNFGDSSSRFQAPSTIRLLIENGFSHPAAGWYLSKTRDRFFNPLELLAEKPVPLPELPRLPQSILYSDIGWAVLRDSWENDATLLAVKSGFTWNHAHADAGSFVLYHGGVPLIVDSGACSYGRPEYSRYYVQSQAHNVILFNGQGEPPEDHRRWSKFPGRLHSLIDHLGVKYVYADAAGPTSQFFSRNYRHWLWLDNVILIFDDLLSHQDGVLDWLLHYEGSAQANGNKALLANGPARAEVHFIYPESLQASEAAGLAEHDPDRKIPYLVFRASQPSRAQKFITAIIPSPPGGGDLPVLQPLAGAECLGVRVQTGGAVTDVYLNLRADGRRSSLNSNNTIDGWETDAYLLAWTRPAGHAGPVGDPEAVTRFFIACGSYLRRRDRVYLDSLSKVFAVWQK
ncbi:MAG: heparinase II/III domain-containing protein [Terriglobia bacterium]